MNKSPEQGANIKSPEQEKREILQEMWQELLKLRPDPGILCDIVISVEPLRQQAWEELKKQKIPNWILHRIIKGSPFLELQAAEILSKQLSSNADLNVIHCYVKSLKKWAADRLMSSVQDGYDTAGDPVEYDSGRVREGDIRREGLVRDILKIEQHE